MITNKKKKLILSCLGLVCLLATILPEGSTVNAVASGSSIRTQVTVKPDPTVKATLPIFTETTAVAAPAVSAAPTPSAKSPKYTILTDTQSNLNYIPFRLLSGWNGIQTAWDNAAKRIDFMTGETRLSMVIGQRTATLNGESLTLPGAPFSENGITYVPLQTVSQALGLRLQFDSITSSITLKGTVDGVTSDVRLPVIPRGTLQAQSKKPIVKQTKVFKVGKRSYSVQMVTISLLHPGVTLDVVLAGNEVGKVEDLKSMAKRNKAVVAINGTFFDAYTDGSYKIPYGYIVRGGEMKKKSSGDKRTIFTYDNNNLAELIPGLDFGKKYDTGMMDGALQAGPRLVTNGKIALDVKAEGFRDPKILTGGGARSALGITRDHKLILLTSSGATIPQLAEIMKQAGAYQAMNLDGGASSGLYYNGQYLTTPGRKISNALIVKLQ